MDTKIWLACNDPASLWALLTRPSDRKKRLVLCACARLPQSPYKEAHELEAVKVAELYADGLASAGELRNAWGRVTGWTLPSLATSRETNYLADVYQLQLSCPNWLPPPATVANVIREIFINPLCPVTLPKSVCTACYSGFPYICPVCADDPGYRPCSWLTPTVLGLAENIYNVRDYGLMPVLADALEDAGCDNAMILDHCRGPGPHVRGCWVIDLLLGKE